MTYDIPPTDSAFETIMALAKLAGRVTKMPREAVLDVCPVCCRPIRVIHGDAICTSAICRYRIIEGCCGN